MSACRIPFVCLMRRFLFVRVKLLEAWRAAEKAEGKGKTKGLKVTAGCCLLDFVLLLALSPFLRFVCAGCLRLCSCLAWSGRRPAFFGVPGRTCDPQHTQQYPAPRFTLG